jgi:hypothetical protein
MKKGGYMSLHCDNIHHSHGQQYGYPQATVLLFLNDNFKVVNLLYLNYNYKSKKVMLLFFRLILCFHMKLKKSHKEHAGVLYHG